MRLWNLLLFIALGNFLLGCGIFEYSPYAVDLPAGYRGLTGKNLAAMGKDRDTGSFSVALISDTHVGYDQLSDVVVAINNEGVAFTIVGGDITDQGLQEEYLHSTDFFKRLNKPFVVVLGNHDCLSQGREVYRQLYGAENFTFVYRRVKFVVLNDILWETGNSEPDFIWLEENLKGRENYRAVVVIAHIPPFSDQSVTYEVRYRELMKRYRVTASIHGHEHHGEVLSPYADGVDYCVIGSTMFRSYLTMTVTADSLRFDRKTF